MARKARAASQQRAGTEGSWQIPTLTRGVSFAKPLTFHIQVRTGSGGTRCTPWSSPSAPAKAEHLRLHSKHPVAIASAGRHNWRLVLGVTIIAVNGCDNSGSLLGTQDVRGGGSIEFPPHQHARQILLDSRCTDEDTGLREA